MVSRILDLNLPADVDRAALPSSAQVALAEFQRRNAVSVATGGPTGNAASNALFFGEDDVVIAYQNAAGDVALIQGDVFLEVKVNSGGIGGQFQSPSITDSGGNTQNLLGQL